MGDDGWTRDPCTFHGLCEEPFDWLQMHLEKWLQLIRRGIATFADILTGHGHEFCFFGLEFAQGICVYTHYYVTFFIL